MKNNIQFLFLVLVVLQSCTNDDELPKFCPPPPPLCDFSIEDFATQAENTDSIVDLNNCIGGFENYINAEKYGYFYPCFNPDNNNEIAYMRQDYETFTGCNFEIWIFNYCTGETRFVSDGICYSIDWSTKDWIVFTGEDRQLWKVKSDGDSLTQITNSGSYNNYAMWNSTGDKLAYWKSRNNGSLFLIADERGDNIDTIPEMIQGAYWHWSSNNEGLSCMKGTIAEEITPAYFDFNNRQFNEMPPVDATLYGFINDTDWLSEDKILWLAPQLIGATDINSQEVIEIVEGFQNRWYHNLTVSSDGDLIVTEREDQFQISNCDVEVKRNLYIMNADGSNERKINIPE